MTAHSGIFTHHPEIWSLMLYQLSLSGFDESCYYLNGLYTNM